MYMKFISIYVYKQYMV